MRTLALFLTFGLLSGFCFGDKAELGKTVPDLTLKTPDGKTEVKLESFRKSSDGKGQVVVIHFWSFKCPSGKRVMSDIKKLAAHCKEKGAKFIGICSYGESADQIAAYAKKNSLDYTLLMDEKARAADLFDADVVTESYIIDATGKLVYRGAFQERDSSPLRTALTEVLAGKNVTRNKTRARG